MVLGISGKAEAGKDTLAIILKEMLENKGKTVLIMHYADELKFYCKQYFGWDGNKNVAGRTILQKIGTDIVRKRDPNYWVESVVRFIKLFYNEYDYILIPDCRFISEYSYLYSSDIPYKAIRINRPNHQNCLTEEQRNHVSEMELDDYFFDYVVTAPEGIDNLKILINNIFQEV